MATLPGRASTPDRVLPGSSDAERDRGTTDRAHADATTRLLRHIFADGEAARFFVVLRNGHELPERLSGNDLDVAVLPGVSMNDVFELVRERASELGWRPVCVNRRRRSIGFSLVTAAGDAPATAIHVDVFDGISAYGISIMSSGFLQSESVLRGTVRQLSDRARPLVTLAHHVGSSGALTKELYVSELEAVLRGRDREWLLVSIADLLGDRVAGDVRRGAAGAARHPLRQPSRARQVHALTAAARRGGAGVRGAIRGVSEYLFGQLPSVARPAGIVGRRGELIRGVGLPLTDTLACGVAPLAMLATTVRSHEARSENSAKHRDYVAGIWSRARVLRLVLPSFFLWLQAKRGRIVVLDTLPLGIRLVRAVARPAWITMSSGART